MDVSKILVSNCQCHNWFSLEILTPSSSVLNPLLDGIVTEVCAKDVKILAELGANLEFINELRKTPANIGLEKGDKR